MLPISLTHNGRRRLNIMRRTNSSPSYLVRTYYVNRYALATFVIHTFKRTITSYYLNFLLNPARPIRPKPRRSMVAGSGTG